MYVLLRDAEGAAKNFGFAPIKFLGGLPPPPSIGMLGGGHAPHRRFLKSVPGGSSLSVFPRGQCSYCSILARRGSYCRIFGREMPENGAEGAVLENFCDFSKKLSLKNAIKTENLGV